LTAKLLEIAYPGTSVFVVLDGGKQTEKTERKVRRALQHKATVERLSRDQIEAYFTPNAVKGRLAVVAEALPDGVAGAVNELLKSGVTKTKLEKISLDSINRHRHYDVDADGRAIALSMRVQDIDLEVKELLLRLVADLGTEG